MEYEGLAQDYHKIYKESVIVSQELGMIQAKIGNLIFELATLENKLKQKKKGDSTDLRGQSQ